MMLAHRNIFDPFAALERELGASACARPAPARAAGLPIHVWEEDASYTAEAELPGLGPEDITIEVLGRTVRIRAERNVEPAGEDAAGDAGGSGSTRARRSFRAVREFVLPRPIDADGVSASLDRGVLTVRFPKAESERPRRIAVQAGGTTGTPSEN